MSAPVEASTLVSAISSVVSAAAALVAALILDRSMVIAEKQIAKAIHLQRRTTSSQLWDAYLGRALQYPMFAFPKKFIGKFDFERTTFDKSKEEFERYEWFVSTLLRATDETILEFGDNDHRAQTALQNVCYHREYLRWRVRQCNQEDYVRLLSEELKAFVAKLADERQGSEKQEHIVCGSKAE
jgi:hypothetical protein